MISTRIQRPNRQMYYVARGQQRVAEFGYIGVGVGDVRSSHQTGVNSFTDIAGVNFYRCLHNGQTCNLIFADGAWEQYDGMKRHLSESGKMHVSTVGSVQIS